MFIQLKPRRERSKSVVDLINDLRPKVSRFPGIRVFLTAPPSIRIGGHMGKSSYDFTVQAPDTSQLYREAVNLEKAIAKLPALVDVTTDLQVKNPQMNLDIDRDRAAVLGLNATQIENTLNSAFGPRWASTIYAPTNQFRVLLEIQPKYQAFTDYLSKIYFKTAGGNLIPLDNFVSLKPSAGPQSIAHSGQLPSVSISFSTKPGVSLGEAVKMVQDTARQVLPANMSTSYGQNLKLAPPGPGIGTSTTLVRSWTIELSPVVLLRQFPAQAKNPIVSPTAGWWPLIGSPAAGIVEPVLRVARRPAAALVEPVPELNGRRAVPAAADVHAHAQRVLERLVPARRVDVGPAVRTVPLRELHVHAGRPQIERPHGRRDGPAAEGQRRIEDRGAEQHVLAAGRGRRRRCRCGSAGIRLSRS